MKHFISIFLAIVITQFTYAQIWQTTYKADLPMRVSNNAVSYAKVNDTSYVYTFGGIDSSKVFSGITKKCFRYNTISDVWTSFDTIPDTLGKIAMSASQVKNRIYLIGGYHVSSTGNEVSSNKVHVFDPVTNTFLANGQNIPVPIDDQVQCVWKDSLIYVITGWSSAGNVPYVQIYNTASNTWLVGTTVPSNSTYKAFGASGLIVGDTIYYYGGAAMGNNFPTVSSLRKGVINPNNPSQITWTNPFNFTGFNGYRCSAASDSLGNVYFMGGSGTSYNYNGIAYNGTGGVNPSNNIIYLNTQNQQWWVNTGQILPMDLRGIAEVSGVTKYIVGGMENGQVVSNKTIALHFVNTNALAELGNLAIRIYPNPGQGLINFEFDFHFEEDFNCEIFNSTGRLIYNNKMAASAILNKYSIDLATVSAGLYTIRLRSSKINLTRNIVITP